MKSSGKGLSQVFLIMTVFVIGIGIAAVLAFKDMNIGPFKPQSSPTPEISKTETASPTPTTASAVKLRKYEDPKHGFAFTYPESYKQYSTDQAYPRQLVAAEKRTSFDNTPLSTTSKFSVSYFPNDKTIAECLDKSSELDQLIKDTDINNLNYRYSEISETAGAGSRYTNVYYRTFLNNKCYEVVLSFKASSDWNKSSDQTSADKEKSVDWNELNDILATLTFTLSGKSDQPVVTQPVTGAVISSPFKLKGSVPPGWMFEGVFPVKLTDENKNTIVLSQAHEVTPGSWQSGEAVNFEANLEFSTSAKSGFIILENDNPSGDPSRSKTYEIPVKF